MGHFVSSPREREKRDKRDSRGDEREGLGRKRNRNESEEIRMFPQNSYLLQGKQALPNCKLISVGRPGDVTYTPSHHPTTPATMRRKAYSFTLHQKYVCLCIVQVSTTPSFQSNGLKLAPW